MTPNFTSGDRVVGKGRYDWTETPGRAGMVVAGPGARLHDHLSNTEIVIGPEFAVVQFDDQKDGQAQLARIDDLTLEDNS